MLTNYWTFQHRSVQTFGFVYHDTNGQNHGPVWKTWSISLTLRTWIYSKWSKNARKKLETLMAPAILCKTCKKSKNGETRGKTHEIKSLRKEESLPNYHEDHFAGRADNSLQHYHLVHKISFASNDENTGSKSSIGKNMENLRKFRRGIWRTSETNLKWSMKQEIKMWKYTLHRGPTIWKVMPKSVWNDFESW